jgi:alcohol dehydrogenase class IV
VLSERERSFTWRDGERVVRFGADALDEAASLLADHGFEGYALLTTPRAGEFAPSLAGMADRVLAVPPGPVPNAAAAVRGKVGQRPLVALGGGRVIDSAKAIGAADGLAVAAVPTTLSGAELTGFHRLPAGVERVKLVRPSLVVAVPELMASQPMPALAASAMNALAHAAESLYSTGANPVAELVALRAAALIRGGLTSSGEGPMPEALALGSLLAAYALDSAGYAVHHVVCQTLVRATGTPHAETNAVMLPHSARFMTGRAPEALARLAVALGRPRAEPGQAAELLFELTGRSGHTRLSTLGAGEAHVEEVAATVAAHPLLGNTPEPPGEAEIAVLVREAL